MALQKSINTSYGIQAAYWKVGQTKVDFHNKTCSVRVIGFVNAQARTDLMQSISSKDYQFNGEAFTFDVEQKLIAQIYAKVKAQADFSGATDV